MEKKRKKPLNTRIPHAPMMQVPCKYPMARSEAMFDEDEFNELHMLKYLSISLGSLDFSCMPVSFRVSSM